MEGNGQWKVKGREAVEKDKVETKANESEVFVINSKRQLSLCGYDWRLSTKKQSGANHEWHYEP